MNELHFAHRVRQHLNRGLYELPAETTDRLAKARQLALSRQKQTVPQTVLAAAGSFFAFHFDNPRIRQLAASFALLLCLAGSSVWIADQRVEEQSAIDSALLSDDLPIGVFTDKGFDAWLKDSSPQ